MLDQIPPQDLPWQDKHNSVIFRGTLTGMLPTRSAFSMAYRTSASDLLSDDAAYDKCQELERCRLVYEANAVGQNQPDRASLVDVKLVTPRLQHIDLPETIHNISLFGERMTKQGLLKHKAIVMLEGNDAGTGLKWALFSNSVVMAPATPKFTSWAMEEKMVPWYHFIPLDPENFGIDLFQKMQWIVDHDDEAQQIALQGSLWIRDLWLHPDAQSDDEQIIADMVRRYGRHFREDTSLEF
jgi:Glycosyl transferase family 90